MHQVIVTYCYWKIETLQDSLFQSNGLQINFSPERTIVWMPFLKQDARLRRKLTQGVVPMYAQLLSLNGSGIAACPQPQAATQLTTPMMEQLKRHDCLVKTFGPRKQKALPHDQVISSYCSLSHSFFTNSSKLSGSINKTPIALT